MSGGPQQNPWISRKWPTRVLLAFAVMTGLVCLAHWYHYMSGYVFDDAYIAFRFSDHWASGLGPVWNIGEDPVEGFTSFSWVLMAALWQALVGVVPEVSMPFVGMASWLVTTGVIIPVILLRIAPVEGSRPVTFWITSAVTVAALQYNAYLAIHAFHGLETALHMLNLGLLTVIALLPVTRKQIAFLVAATCFAVMTRPDTLAFAGILWICVLVFAGGPTQRKTVCVGGVVVAVLFATYTAGKWLYFGYPVPNTFYVKKEALHGEGVAYVLDYFRSLERLLILTSIAAAAVLPRIMRDRMFAILFFPSFIFCLTYTRINPLMGTFQRFLIPTLPLFGLACLRACHVCIQSASASRGRVLRWGTSFLLPFLYAWFLVAMAVESEAAFLKRQERWERMFLEYTEWTLADNGRCLAAASELSPPPLLATGDVGAIPYYSGLPTLDLIGLCNEHVAHEGLDHAYLMQRQPDLFVLQDLTLVPREAEKNIEDMSSYIEIDMEGKKRLVDVRAYLDTGDDMLHTHTGGGSTYQVVTLPGFPENYRYVKGWGARFFPHPVFHVFVRNEYEHVDELVEILEGTE